MIDWSYIERKLAAHWNATPRAEGKMLSLAIGGISEGILRNKMRPLMRWEVDSLIEKMEKDGRLTISYERHGRNGTLFKKISNPFAEKLRDECFRAFDIFYMQSGEILSFDVSQPCDYLMLSIQDAVRAASFHQDDTKFLIELSDDCRDLRVSCVEVEKPCH